jgi:hypothetical protein
MSKHALLAVAAAILLSTSSGCVWWRHCWGSWAYYGACDSCGYCDNCPPGPCGGCHEPFSGCCNDGCGSYDSCGGCCNDCCDDCCHPFAFLHHLFHSPGPLGCCDYPCQGCGEKYYCDWINSPPTCEPCDCCGNYTGCDPRPCYQQSPRYGSVPMHSDYADGQVMEAPMEQPVRAEPQKSIPPQSKRYRPQPTGVQKAAYRGQRPAGLFSK